MFGSLVSSGGKCRTKERMQLVVGVLALLAAASPVAVHGVRVSHTKDARRFVRSHNGQSDLELHGASIEHLAKRNWTSTLPVSTAALPLISSSLGANGHLKLQDDGPSQFRNPDVWGPPTWFFLHSMTLALPESVPAEQQENVKNVMYNLQKILPCPSCGKNLAHHMREHPLEPHLGTRDEMVQWMIDVHNMVNKDCGKREWSKDEVLSEYGSAFAKGNTKRFLTVIGHDRNAAGMFTRTPSLLLVVVALAHARQLLQ
mmetsp:Transcript_22883/g.44526  ORF Transcript_22883/g.44526 Transcript_22883/m.44526 type:complete len:258 (-) Transcript_22883:115-888(-)